MGLCKLHLGITKVQLYKYLFDTRKYLYADRRETVPFVYYEFIWYDKQLYDAVLSVYIDT